MSNQALVARGHPPLVTIEAFPTCSPPLWLDLVNPVNQSIMPRSITVSYRISALQAPLVHCERGAAAGETGIP